MEEKKLTDEEIAKAILQNIEYGKTVTYFDEWGNCKTIMVADVLDLIHRLQKENEELKSPKFASWKLKFFNLKEEFDKELAEHEEFTKKANAEIERLTEENGYLDGCAKQFLADYQKCEIENAELQKQVDVLTAEKENLYFLNKNLEDYIDNHEPIWKRNTEQAVKDTAKECYEIFKFYRKNFYDIPLDLVARDIKEKTDVEVE